MGRDKDMAGLSVKQQNRINNALEGLSGAEYAAKRSELISEQKSKNDYMNSLRNKANSTQGSMPVGTTVVNGSDINKLETELRDVAEKEAKTANTCDEWSNYYCDKDSVMYKQMQEAKERAEAAAKAAQLLLQKIEDIKKFVSDADEQVKEMVISISLDELKVSATTNTNRYVSTNMLSSHKEVWNNAVNKGVVSETARERGDTPSEEWSKGVDDVLNKMDVETNVNTLDTSELKALYPEYTKKLGDGTSLIGTTFAATTVGDRFYDAHAYTLSKKEDEFLKAICNAAEVPYELMVAVVAHESGSVCAPRGGYTGFVCTGNTGWTENCGAYYTGAESRVATDGEYSYVNGVTAHYTSGSFDTAEWREVAAKLGADVNNTNDPYMSLLGGVAIMRDNMNKYDSLDKVIDKYGESSRYGTGCASSKEIISYANQLGITSL